MKIKNILTTEKILSITFFIFAIKNHEDIMILANFILGNLWLATDIILKEIRNKD